MRQIRGVTLRDRDRSVGTMRRIKGVTLRDREIGALEL